MPLPRPPAAEALRLSFSSPFCGADLLLLRAKITDEAKLPRERRIFRLELLLPTEAFGMVRAELAVWGKGAP